MKLVVDTEKNELVLHENGSEKAISLYSKEAFELVSHYWLKIGWNQKYSYTFTWMGTPVIQLPEDMLRMQELIYRLQPDVIIETGIAHGGSLSFYASLCHIMGKGKIIGIDCKIQEHSRTNLENHPLRSYFTLIEGDSGSDAVRQEVQSLIQPDAKVLVILDSNHTYEHVSRELTLYSEFVTPGSYIIVMDGIMTHLHDVPRGQNHWQTDNPANAARDFVANNKDFVLEQPEWLFNESHLDENITYYTSGWLRRLPST